MFKLHRQHTGSPPKSGERVDFKFSSFQAIQVPKGWDKLYLAVISVETGKTIAKLGKSTVRNGNCQWTETLLESVWISKEDSSHELEECLFKFVVSMGSSRAGILGEAIINFSSFMNSSSSSSPVLCPLAKCSYGTIFQVKIQCLTLTSPLRKENLNRTSSNETNQAAKYRDSGLRPNRFVDTLSNGAKAPPSQGLDIASNNGGYDSKESGYSESVSSKASKNTDKRGLNSHHSLNSDGFSPHQKQSGSASPLPHHLIARHSLSSQSSYNNSEEMSPRMGLQSSGKESNGGSVNLLEVAEKTIDELRAEAKMWERNARKLMIDLELLRKDFLEQSKKQADVVMELSGSCTEQEVLKKEIEKLKFNLEELSAKNKALENSSFQYGSYNHIQKELESEIKFHNETNANLASQLKKSQESNIELLSVLQELEETIEQQKVEIQTIKEEQLKLTRVDNSKEQDLYQIKNLLLQVQHLQDSETTLKTRVQFLENSSQNRSNNLEKERNNASDVDLVKELESLREKLEELERDCNELTDENLELVLKLKDLKNNRVDKSSSFSSSSSDFPSKSMSEMSDHEPVYDQELKRKLYEEEACEFVLQVLKQIEVTLQHLMKPLIGTSSDVSEKCKYLLADLVNIRRKDTQTYNLKSLNESAVNCFFEVNKIVEDRIAEYEWGFKYDELETQRRDATILEAENRLKDLIQMVEEQEQSKEKLGTDHSNLLNEFSQQKYKIDELEDVLLKKDDEIESLGLRQVELEDQISDLEKQKGLMEENSIMVLGESNTTAKCLNKLRDELAILNSSLETNVTAKEFLEKKVSDLEIEKLELENGKINSEHDLLQLKEVYQSCQIEMRNSESRIMNLQAQIEDMEIEMETLKKNLEIELKDKLAAQKECEHFQTENRNFELAYNELKMKEIELRKLCTILELKFEESEESVIDCSQKMEFLEKKLASMVEEFSVKDKNLTSELETLLQENENVKEKLVKMSAEVKNFMIEIESLTNQKITAHEEYEKLKSETSSLQLEKAELESARQKLQSNVEYVENELNELRLKKEFEIHSLISELDGSKQNHTLQTSEHDKLLKRLGSYRKSEEKLMATVNDLELKLTVSDYENQQLREENVSKKIQFQITSDLQDEISRLKIKIEESMSEKDKLEDSLRCITVEYENLKHEKDICMEKITRLEQSIIENESCKKKQALLQEKLQKMEGDLLLKEANCDPRLMENNAEDGSNNAVQETFKRSESSLETELKELSERYLEMSLKYAEVEAQREDLVMKLKAAKGGRSWF